jgi:hypothetical protein
MLQTLQVHTAMPVLPEEKSTATISVTDVLQNYIFAKDEDTPSKRNGCFQNIPPPVPPKDMPTLESDTELSSSSESTTSVSPSSSYEYNYTLPKRKGSLSAAGDTIPPQRKLSLPASPNADLVLSVVESETKKDSPLLSNIPTPPQRKISKAGIAENNTSLPVISGEWKEGFPSSNPSNDGRSLSKNGSETASTRNIQSREDIVIARVDSKSGSRREDLENTVPSTIEELNDIDLDDIISSLAEDYIIDLPEEYSPPPTPPRRKESAGARSIVKSGRDCSLVFPQAPGRKSSKGL